MDLLREILTKVISKSSYAFHADRLAELVNGEMLLTLGAISELTCRQDLSANKQVEQIRSVLHTVGLSNTEKQNLTAP